MNNAKKMHAISNGGDAVEYVNSLLIPEELQEVQ